MTYTKFPKAKLAVLRAQQMAEQGGKCPVSGWYLTEADAVADHCHRTGMHRATLHSWANSRLGKIENAARSMGRDVHIPTFLRACADYIEHHDSHPSFLFHHTFKTPDEKREHRNKKARQRRAAAKVAK